MKRKINKLKTHFNIGFNSFQDKSDYLAKTVHELVKQVVL